MKDGIRVAEIKVRKLEPVIVKKIDELAAEKGMKREAFLRMHLTSFAITKYSALVKDLAERLEQANDVIERSMILEEEILKVLGVISNSLQ